MPRLLPLVSLLLLQSANLAAAQQSWVTATINGTPVSWQVGGTSTPVATAVISGHKVSFTITPTPGATVPSVPTRSFEPPHPSTPSKSPSHHSPSHTAQHHKTPHKSSKKHPTTPTSHPSPGHSHNGHSSGTQHGGGNGGASRQTGSPQPHSADSGPNRSLVIGLSVGFTLIALIIIGIVAFVIYKRRKARGYTSTASSIHEEGKAEPPVREVAPAPFAPDAQPTLPAVVALPSARNSTASFGPNDDNRLSAAPSETPISAPWVPKTRSRLSQLQQIQQPASPPPMPHNIPRRPVGASSP